MAADKTLQADAGMPQLDFGTFPNQGLWLLVTLLCLFLMVRLLIIPRMDNILSNRRKVIEEDLVEAEKFRDAAKELEKSINVELESAKLKASEMISRGKEKSKADFEKSLEEANEITEKLLTDSNKKIRKMQKNAESQIDEIAAALVPEILKKVSN